MKPNPTTIARQAALRSPIDPTDADEIATASWVIERTRQLADVARLTDVGIHTDPDNYRLAGGTHIVPETLGMATRHPALLYIAPGHQRGRTDTVIAHEITHLTHWHLGHRARFFELVQALLDRAGHPPA